MKKVLFSSCFKYNLFLIVFLFSIQARAQKPPIKFGKVSNDLLEMTDYANDTNASAVILCDYGKTYFEYYGRGFRMHFHRIIRIKILDKEGYKWANWSIPLLNFGEIKEEVTQLKGIVYNLHDGKVVKEKLNGSGKFTEKVHRYFEKLKFTMPNVIVGSVIDIEYTVVSPFYYNLRDWYFQYDIPVKWSEYIVEIPEYFNYVRNMKGYFPLYINEKGSKYEQLSVGAKIISMIVGTERYVAKDVPAFIQEEPLSSKENYISKMEYELASYRFPFDGPKKISATWESINNRLMSSGNFGGRLHGGGFLKSTVEAIQTQYDNSYDKMVAAYDYIQSYMKWNGVSRIYAYDPLRTAYKDKVGADSDINLMLIVLLKELGITAFPVLISTRDHGMVQQTHPTLSGMNSVVVKVILDGKDYLMDASAPFVPCGILPVKALNGKGRLISKKHTEWVVLLPKESFGKLTMYTLRLNEKGVFTGDIQFSDKGYAAISLREELDKYESEDKFIEDIVDKNEGLYVNSFEFADRENLLKDVNGKFTVEIKDKAVEAGNLLYFNPMFFEGMEENPFKLEERLYPVEYANKKDVTYMLNFTIPIGYKLEDKPENEAVSLPDNAGIFTYQVSINGRMIQLISKYSINKLTFPAEDYEYLKEFYNHIVAKHAEQIVLIKE